MGREVNINGTRRHDKWDFYHLVSDFLTMPIHVRVRRGRTSRLYRAASREKLADIYHTIESNQECNFVTLMEKFNLSRTMAFRLLDDYSHCSSVNAHAINN